MKIDYLGVENESKEVKDKKKEEFIKRLQEAIKKRENKEKKEIMRIIRFYLTIGPPVCRMNLSNLHKCLTRERLSSGALNP